MNEDRRKSWRFPVLPEQQGAELRVGDVALPVRLVDQSATGFLIECDQHPGVYVGENVWLQTSSGWSEVRVIKIRHEIEGTCIGLERMAEATLERPSNVGVLKPDDLKHETPYSSPWPTVIMLLALGGAMLFVAWTAIDRSGSQRLFDLVGRPERSSDGRSAAVRAMATEARRRNAELQRTLEDFGEAFLTLPDVVQHLRLSPSQTGRLQEIIDRTFTLEETLRRQNGSSQHLADEIASLYRQAGQEALSLLDARQREDWQNMLHAALESLGGNRTKPASAL